MSIIALKLKTTPNQNIVKSSFLVLVQFAYYNSCRVHHVAFGSPQWKRGQENVYGGNRASSCVAASVEAMTRQLKILQGNDLRSVLSAGNKRPSELRKVAERVTHDSGNLMER